jgi:hypothetical protein
MTVFWPNMGLLRTFSRDFDGVLTEPGATSDIPPDYDGVLAEPGATSDISSFL